MNRCCKSCLTPSTCIGVLISIVVAIIVGVLFALNNIPLITTAAWIAFGLSVLSLIFLILGAFISALTLPNSLSMCLCKHVVGLLVGIIGTLVFTIIALSIVLCPLVISNVIIVALGTLFFTFLLIELISFIVCIICKSCCVMH